MGWTFRMVFEGVCAFVTDKPLFLQDGNSLWHENPIRPKELTVLIPDLQKPALARGSTLENPLFRAAHFPLLMFERADLDARSSRFVDLTLQDPASTVQKGVCVLQGEAIRLGRLPKCKLEMLTQVAPQPTPTPEDQSSLWWLPNLAEIAPEFGNFDTALKPVRGQRVDSRLACAISIRQGRLSALDFNFPDEGAIKPTVWHFSTGEPNSELRWRRAVSNRIVLEFTDLVAPFELTFERVNDGHRQESRALFSPPSSSRKRVVEVHVANVELEKLFAETDLFPEAGKGLVDADFEAFYALMPKAGKQPLPIPRVRPELVALGPVKQPCAPSQGTF
jgi:hypothetical protein